MKADSRLAAARSTVVALLVLLFAITYLDRVCISVAGPRMQEDLHLNLIQWGWVTGVFTLSYCLFEIPTGALGDRIGPRRVVSRIVLWWSAFTGLTGAVSGYQALLVIRFLFGAGEAGAFPNAGIVVSRWFPPSQRATLMGVTLMASQIGGALAPLVVVPIQMRWGWRVSFFLFGSVGILWATVWYIWFRDSPAERIRGIASVGVSASNPHQSAHAFPWQTAFRSSNLLAFLVIAFSYVYVYNFFQTWFHTFLVKGRGFSEAGLFLSALPYVVATFANLLGGAVSDALVRRLGRLNGRRAIGSSALGAAGVFTIAAMLTNQQVMTVVFLALVYGAITFQQSGALAVCLDIGHEYAGAMTGLFNTASQLGGLLGSVAYGYIVERSGSYNAPFVPMIALLFLGSLLWLRVDASQALAPESALPTLASR